MRGLRAHGEPEILAHNRSGASNGIAESNNAAIGRIRANARGFHEAVGRRLTHGNVSCPASSTISDAGTTESKRLIATAVVSCAAAAGDHIPSGTASATNV